MSVTQFYEETLIRDKLSCPGNSLESLHSRVRNVIVNRFLFSLLLVIHLCFAVLLLSAINLDAYSMRFLGLK